MPRVRHLGLLAAVILLIAAAIGIAPATAQSPVRDVASSSLAIPAGVTVSGLDLHDGQLIKVGGTFELVGTEYGCGYSWYTQNTPWCGLGVSTAPSMNGPWSSPTLLFSPNDIDPWTGTTWNVECGGTGQGCFNGRILQRTGWGANDGAWILWFNSPVDYSRSRANAYNVMGCNGPTGPCGPSAGAPYGSYHKPSLWSDGSCNGDFGFIQPPVGAPAMVCSQAGAIGIAIEQLDYWGTNGVQGTGGQGIGGMTSVEGPGGYYDQATGAYILTYSDPGCGYCAGTGTGYATASSLLGPYTAPVNVAAGAPPATGRRDLSATSCGGQPRTVSVIDGQAYQGIDLWTGTPNETHAGLRFEPLTYTSGGGTAGDGRVWHPPFADWTCN